MNLELMENPYELRHLPGRWGRSHIREKKKVGGGEGGSEDASLDLWLLVSQRAAEARS